MSTITTKSIKCPKCAAAGEIQMYSAVNTAENPEEAAKIRDLSAFTFTCPDCGSKTEADYKVLYHDPDKQLMIYYARRDEDAKKIEEMFLGKGIYDVADDIKGRYLYRIVRSKRHLQEKIAIFEQGLDDRFMELAKVYYLTKFEAEYPDLVPTDAYIYGSDGTYFVAFSTDDGEISTEFDLAVYRHMQSAFPDLKTPLRGGNVNIDFGWAMGVFKQSSLAASLSAGLGGDIKIRIEDE